MAAPTSTSRPAGAAVAGAARLPMAVVQWASARRSAPTITPLASPSEQQAVAAVAVAAADAFATGADLWGVDAVPSEAGWAGSRGWGGGTDPWTWRTFYKGIDGRLRLSGVGGGRKSPRTAGWDATSGPPPPRQRRRLPPKSTRRGRGAQRPPRGSLAVPTACSSPRLHRALGG
eukprot:TRINITY_DN1133_c0_g1_i1.p2 TRINITY_DN1133_c0_g1~~TRINITY_DN1133_c0_g1_i1.p2  ORF type:complete len:174 (-),score=19.38 TRINITY_DN1133_c0_g1_i1:1078-1599(-)